MPPDDSRTCKQIASAVQAVADSLVARRRARAVAVVLCVGHDCQTVFAGPAGLDRIVPLGCLLKPCIAVAVLRLASRNQLQLNDPVTVPHDAGARSPTVSELLSHTYSRITKTGESVLRTEYTHTAYNQLALQIEAATGMPWSEVVARETFEPGDVDVTISKPEGASDLQELLELAGIAYESEGKWYRDLPDPSYAVDPTPASAGFISINELGKLARILSNSSLSQSTWRLPDPLLELLTRPVTTSQWDYGQQCYAEWSLGFHVNLGASRSPGYPRELSQASFGHSSSWRLPMARGRYLSLCIDPAQNTAVVAFIDGIVQFRGDLRMRAILAASLPSYRRITGSWSRNRP